MKEPHPAYETLPRALVDLVLSDRMRNIGPLKRENPMGCCHKKR